PGWIGGDAHRSRQVVIELRRVGGPAGDGGGDEGKQDRAHDRWTHAAAHSKRRAVGKWRSCARACGRPSYPTRESPTLKSRRQPLAHRRPFAGEDAVDGAVADAAVPGRLVRAQDAVEARADALDVGARAGV